MSLPASDNFNRADEDPLAGNWTDPAALGDSTFILTSQHLIGRGGANFQLQYWNADVFNSNQKSQVTISGGSNLTNTGTYAAAAVRVQASGQSCYFFGIRAGAYQLMRVDSGIPVALTGGLVDTPTAGDIVRIEITGAAIDAFLNNVLRFSATDATYTGGSAGLFGYGSSGVFEMDNWLGDNMGAYLLVKN